MLAALGTLARILPFDAIELLSPVDPSRIPGPPDLRFPVSGFPFPVSCSHWGAPDAGPANDRRVAVEVAHALGDHDARVVTTMSELEEAIVPMEHWVAKATICAAGRDRVRRRPTALSRIG
jgi:hypothetical protein